jgi:hypothetical protein
MTLQPNTEQRAGRMFDALLRTENSKGKVVLTINVSDADGNRRMHETFAVTKWANRSDTRHLLFVGIPSTADWDAGVRPANPLTFNIDTGELEADKRDPRVTPLLAWAARAVWRYVAEGVEPSPANGSATIREESICGACGMPLTDDVSIRLGYGPDCEQRLFGTRTPRSRTMTAASAGEARPDGDENPTEGGASSGGAPEADPAEDDGSLHYFMTGEPEPKGPLSSMAAQIERGAA